MTVKQLIQKLQQHDPNTRVVIHGYAGGVTDLEDLQEVKINLNVNTEWYNGAHEVEDEGLDALLINGEENE